MKKLFGSSFLWMRSTNNSHAMNVEEFAAPATAGLVKLWWLSAAVLLGAILLGPSAPVMGQAVNATLVGTVTDSSGATVSNAKVTITETNTGITHTSQTNDSGNYVFPDLPPGKYTVIAEQSGFKRESRAGIDLVVNSTERVDLVLQPGNMSETITVEAETPILQTERADTGRKLEEVLTENVPLGTNRNFQNLLNIVPGTTRATFQHSQFFNASSSLQTEVNGQLREGNNYQIEGIDHQQFRRGTGPRKRRRYKCHLKVRNQQLPRRCLRICEEQLFQRPQFFRFISWTSRLQLLWRQYRGTD
jgi:hypothetical protein